MNPDIEELRKIRRLPYMPGLTLTMANLMISAGIKEAEKYGMPVSIAIYDCGGNLLAFNRMENAMLCGIQIAMDKAYTAVYGKLHTGGWGEMYKTGNLVPLFFHERWITYAAGFPLIKTDAIMGGIGVSGAVSEDLYIARAVIREGGFDMDEVNSAIEKVEASKRK